MHLFSTTLVVSFPSYVCGAHFQYLTIPGNPCGLARLQGHPSKVQWFPPICSNCSAVERLIGSSASTGQAQLTFNLGYFRVVSQTLSDDPGVNQAKF